MAMKAPLALAVEVECWANTRAKRSRLRTASDHRSHPDLASDSMSFPAIECDVSVGDERDQVGQLQAGPIREVTLDRRQDGAAKNRHHQKR